MSTYRLRYIHVHVCTRNVAATNISGQVHGRVCTLLTLDECHVVSWSDKCT